MQTLFGGSKSSSSSGGFSQLPSEIQNTFKQLGTGTSNQLLNNPTQAGQQYFTPMGVQPGEQNAINHVNSGFAPTQQSIQSDVNAQMNPYDSSVIDTINRQSGGDYSILKQAMAGAGQMGSNRGLLGANDIDLSRLNQIGTFKQNEYNQAVQNSLGPMTQARQQDAQAQLGVGDMLRNLQLQTQQAPLSALSAASALMGVLPQTAGGSQQSASSSPGLFSLSDVTAKENIIHIGEENGYPIYEFNYIEEIDPHKKRYIGVMAHDVEKIMPNAVSEQDGYKTVNYHKIGIEMREAK